MSTVDQTETQHFNNSTNDSTSTYLLLDVSDTGIVLPDVFGESISISQRNLLIYAENVTINQDILWPSGNIGIACSALTLTKSSVVIDVSGASGEGVAPNPSGPGEPGQPGKVGGSIWLYIEQHDPDLAIQLSLKANGGDGGIGGSTSSASANAGTGGAGGSGGFIPLTYTHCC